MRIVASRKSSLLLWIGFMVVFGVNQLYAQKTINNYDQYHTPEDINGLLIKFNKQFPDNTYLHNLAVTPGNRKLLLLEIGPEVGKSAQNLPAVLVVGNMEGTVPISSEAAIYLADLILSKPDVSKNLTWYILPCGNPDAAMFYFNKPLRMDSRNALPHNDDMDEQVDEDDFNDLDGNGIITQMRVEDPNGEWILLEGDPRIMKKADYSKGEKGKYKLYTEGLDDDGDGKYNEDVPGGVNVGINFPHLFKPFTKTGGVWPGSVDESFQIMKFVFEHPELALTINFGSTNFCMLPPKGGRKGEVDMDKLKIPERFASWFNADPEKTYTMKEVIEMVKPMIPQGIEVNESMVASFLGLGAVVNPLQEDLTFYKELSEKYKEYLKKQGAEPKRLEPSRAKDGSFELWSYYHLGIPTFSMDFWTLPEVKEEKKESSGLTLEKLEKMTDDEFLALGEEKIDAFLKETGAPAQYKAAMVINMVKGGKMNAKQIAGMLKKMPKPKDTKGGDPKLKALLSFSDTQLDGKGFINWKPYEHPTLGKVEIGGAVPFIDNTPPVSMLDSLLTTQAPWVLELIKKLPDLKILKSEVTAQGSNIYELKIWVENTGYLPFPTAMGKRNKQPAPAIVTIEGKGIHFLSGTKRVPILSIEGNKNQKLTWLLQIEDPGEVVVKLESKNAWGDQKQIKIESAK